MYNKIWRCIGPMAAKIKTMRDQVYEILKNSITSGKYRQGQWLQENTLAEELHVSRSPVRDALHQLAKDGLVNEIPNRGVFVREYSLKDIDELFEIRIMFESYAIRAICKNLTESQRQVLEQFKKDFKYFLSKGDIVEYTKSDTLYHCTLIEMAGNATVARFYNSVKDMYAQFRMNALRLPERFQGSADEHIQTIDSILAGKTEEAIRLNEEHLLITKKSAFKTA